MAGLQTDVDPLAAIAYAEKHLAQRKSHTLNSDYSHDRKDDPEIPVQDGIHDGLEFPTEHERHTLRRVADTIPWSAYRKRLSICYHMNLAHLALYLRPNQ